MGKLCSMARFMRAGRKEIILSEGETVHGFYVILSGQVRIFKTGSDGRMQVLHILGAPFSFAEAALFLPCFPATVQTTRRTQLAFINKGSFLKVLGSDRQMALSIISSLSFRLKHLTDTIESLTLMNVPARLAAHILALTPDPGQTRGISSPFSKTALAGLLGTTKETLSRILKKLSRSRILLFRGRTILVLDRKRLEDIVRGSLKY